MNKAILSLFPNAFRIPGIAIAARTAFKLNSNLADSTVVKPPLLVQHSHRG